MQTRNILRLFRTLLTPWVLLIIPLGIISCSKDDFPQYSKLDRLRILALTVDNPEIQNPSGGGNTVQLTPIVSDINGTGNLTLEIQSCLDPGVGLGAEATCASGANASALQTVSMASTPTVVESQFGDPERTGSPQSGSIPITLQIPSNLLPTYSPAIQFNGLSYLIVVKAISASTSVVSFRRILLSTKTPNTNPVLSSTLLDGNAPTLRPSPGTHALSFNPGSSPEIYSFLDGQGIFQTKQETFELTWFASDGLINSPRAPMNTNTEWVLTESDFPVGRQTVLVGVLRDGRGGTNVTIKKLNP